MTSTNPDIAIIVAITRDGAVGRGGNLIYHLRDDLRHFKTLTMGHTIIMGRKTYESLPKRPLPGRPNIVITHDRQYPVESGAYLATSLPQAIDVARQLIATSDGTIADDAIFIIGGAQIYEQALPLTTTLHLTTIDADAPYADTRFPDIDYNQWLAVDSSPSLTDAPTGITYRYITLRRKP